MARFRLPRLFPGFAALERENLDSISVRAMPAVLRRIAGLALAHWGRLLLAAACALGGRVFDLLQPLLLGMAVNQVAAIMTLGPAHVAEAQAMLWKLALMIIGVMSASGVLAMISGYEGEYVSQKVGYKLRLDFFAQLQRLSFGYHDKIHSGDLITRGMLDIEGVRNVIVMGMLNSVSLALLVAAATWRLLSVDLWIGLLALSFVPFTIWRAARLGYMLRVSWMRLQHFMSILTRTMEESLQGMRVVRAFAAKPFEMRKFDEAGGNALRLSNQRITLRVSSVRTVTAAFYLSMGLVMWIGGQRVVEGRMTPGTLTELVLYMLMLQTPIRQVAMVVNSSARATSSGTRLFEVLDTVPEVRDAPDAQPLKLTKGVLKFEDVGFSYDSGPDAKQRIAHIDFEVRPGKTLGIVGPPGAGKSTIAHLIPRFYDPTSGRVTIDGQDLREVTLGSLRGVVGVVQQDTFMFDATVTNNVAYADPFAEDDRIVAATTTAQLHDYLTTLPKGYDTKVGERGVALSGGQRQRMSIARGIVPGPGVMVFDDSTAAIDAATEQRIRAALAEDTRDKATIIIAHRLSSLMHADEILVLEEGRIVERGTHAQLVAVGGAYAALHRLQTEKAGEIPPEDRLPRVTEPAQ
ncbi:MAG TPA: ABC transporter ATP-binding protein [Caulobacteraceae bacterium]|jgi:ATP-binding cassette subfamily B protein|nr:ABC transporter ATP-binding protein [Caulobacteraceae bacterium]